MTIIYRVLTFIINVIALFLTLSIFGSFPVLLSSPITMLSGFMIVAIILYSYFSYRFQRQVLNQGQAVKMRLRDLVRVNGIVAIIFSGLLILEIPVLIAYPEIYSEATKNFGTDIPLKLMVPFFWGMFIYAVCLFIHVLWTFRLMRKYRSFFQQ